MIVSYPICLCEIKMGLFRYVRFVTVMCVVHHLQNLAHPYSHPKYLAHLITPCFDRRKNEAIKGPKVPIASQSTPDNVTMILVCLAVQAAVHIRTARKIFHIKHQRYYLIHHVPMLPPRCRRRDMVHIDRAIAPSQRMVASLTYSTSSRPRLEVRLRHMMLPR